MSSAPVVYILHGDDEIGITEFIEAMRQRMGDPSTADMNTSRFSGRIDLGDLRRAAQAVPFLASRRLVVLDGSAGLLKSKADQEDFLTALAKVPESTALVLVERSELKGNSWLLKWAGGREGFAFVKAMAQPRGGVLVRWIQDEARKRGGEILPQAAQHLVSLIGDDNRAAASELEKLLAYANYNRPVDIDDVEALTAPVTQGDLFGMVDALGARNGRKALTMLHDLLSERDAISLFGMIIRQFRLLLLYKEMSLQNQPPAFVSKALSLPDFVVGKLAAQARNFDLPQLEAIYAELAEIDTAIKTGRIEGDIALDTFVAGITSR